MPLKNRYAECPADPVYPVCHFGSVCQNQLPADQRNPPVERRRGYGGDQQHEHAPGQKLSHPECLLPIYPQCPFCPETGFPENPGRESHGYRGRKWQRQVHPAETAAQVVPAFLWRNTHRGDEHFEHQPARLAEPLRGGDAGRENFQRHHPEQHRPR